MEIKLNIPDWLKIPINVLLPSIWLISGILLLLPERFLDKIYLLSWSNENGFYIGLAFIISSCLLVVYAFYYLKKLFSVGFYNLTYKRRTLKKILMMSNTELAIILKLYHSPGYTSQLDYNQPLTQGLLARKYIYMGGQQQVTLNIFTNSIPALFTLQPFVYQTLDYYKPKFEKEIQKMEKRIENTKNSKTKMKLSTQLDNAKDIFESIYNGGNW